MDIYSRYVLQKSLLLEFCGVLETVYRTIPLFVLALVFAVGESSQATPQYDQ